MNSSRRSVKFALAGGVAAVAVAGAALFALVPAQDQADKPKPDYQGYDLTRPWFDGKPWAWFLDMFNQPSIKPQEVGTFQVFPADSVPRSGAEPFIAATAIVDGKLLRDQIPANPTRATPDSMARGRVLYETYCGVCHGLEGQAGTPVVQKGM
ncbi:MAG: cytochrome c, partial [SAR324 cluster bacterium]|nr:cytochrome c [SAR324 cluster bacterium]